MKWQEKLTRDELKHMRDMGDRTLSEFRETRKLQLALEAEHPKTIACFECRHIAKKLGIA